jgi:hypothetical protein
MTRFRPVFLLSILLLCAQQGAMLHELGHVYRTASPQLGAGGGVTDGKACETCLAFAQVANPASGTLFVLPAVRFVYERSAEPEYSITAASVLAPRSRGPPIFP